VKENRFPNEVDEETVEFVTSFHYSSTEPDQDSESYSHHSETEEDLLSGSEGDEFQVPLAESWTEVDETADGGEDDQSAFNDFISQPDATEYMVDNHSSLELTSTVITNREVAQDTAGAALETSTNIEQHQNDEDNETSPSKRIRLESYQ